MRKRGLNILALAFAAVVCHVAAVSSVLGSKDKEAVNADTLIFSLLSHPKLVLLI